MDYILSLIDFILHIDRHLADFTSSYEHWVYVILFLIIFCETGLIIMPFLPGDSLLFAAGALAALPEAGLSVFLLILVMIVAAILGDFLNYSIGRKFGEALTNKGFKLIKISHVKKTEEFFAKHGSKTIIMARFLPIVRTFAPFVAGIGRMPYLSFARYNVTGALIWVILFVLVGFLFGNIPAIKNHFSLMVLGIIVFSVLPIIYAVIRSRLAVVKK